MKHKPIIIVEGPAGSGKSTLTKLLAQELGLPIISRSLVNRNPSGDEAVFHSQLKDHVKLVEALWQPRGAVIDRLFWSQWVYGNLRRGCKSGSHPVPGVDWQLAHMEWYVSTILDDLATRKGRSYSSINPRFFTIVLLPSESRLTAQRAEVEREFPWTPEQELSMYRRLEHLQGGEYFLKFCLWSNSGTGRLVQDARDFVSKYHS